MNSLVTSTKYCMKVHGFNRYSGLKAAKSPKKTGRYSAQRNRFTLRAFRHIEGTAMNDLASASSLTAQQTTFPLAPSTPAALGFHEAALAKLRRLIESHIAEG